jgi:hypothetical protein
MKVKMYLIMTATIIIAIIAYFTGISEALEKTQIDSLKSINSKSEKERTQAKEQILTARKEEIKELISIVNAPVEQNEPFMSSTTSRNIAISLLGSLHAKEAVPLLIEWLVPKKDMAMVVSEESILSPAGSALAEIGLPSLKPLLKKITEEGASNLGVQCLTTLTYILGPEISELRLNKMISLETDENKQRNLQESLKFLKEQKLPKLLYKNPEE